MHFENAHVCEAGLWLHVLACIFVFAGVAWDEEDNGEVTSVASDKW